MIVGTHAIVYADDAERARAFFRDVLGMPNVDAGDGWLIFQLPPAELAVHPAAATDAGRHELYLMCDDITKSVDELRAEGVEFIGEVEAVGWGSMIMLKVPGGGTLRLYEPRHPVAYDL